MSSGRYDAYNTGGVDTSAIPGGESLATRARKAQHAVNQNKFAEANFQNESFLQNRRVNAAVGGATSMDISQRYDPFGNNSFSSADNPWAAFFGAPTSPWKTTSYDKYDRHNYNLPEAYVGQNLYIGQTIDELIYSDETFYTSVLLPFNFTDQMGVSWDKWEFNEHFTGIVPEQGVSRLVSSHRESRSESFIRRGLGLILEHGFMSTPQGRANYFLSLAQIARAVQETTNFGVIYAYLTCQNYNKQWEEKHGYFRKSTLQELLERENFMWAIAVKSEFGMEKLDAQVVEWMNRYRASADTWILPPKPAIYLRLVPAEKVYHYLAGEEGPRRVNDIVGAGRPHESNAPNKRTQDVVEPYAVFKKNNVYLTRTYHVERTGPIDLMMRVSSVGEYFKIVNTMNSCDYRSGYMSCYLDTRIYDEENDKGFTVSVAQALRYCQVFNADGSPRVPDNAVNPYDAQDLKECFFLRSQPTSDGGERFVPISYMGDIDPQFFRPEDAANLALTVIRASNVSDADLQALRTALNDGQALIADLAMRPLRDTSGGDSAAAENEADFNASLTGKTSWPGLIQISRQPNTQWGNGAPRVAAAYIQAVRTVASRMGSILGGNANLFLDPNNALPIYANVPREAAQTLHENLINFRAVPVYSVDFTGNVRPGRDQARAAAVANIYDLVLGGLLNPSVQADAAILANRKMDTAELSKFRASLQGKTGAGLESILSFLERNPGYSRAKAEAELAPWIKSARQAYNNIDARLEEEARRAGTEQLGAVTGRDARVTLLAVYPENQSILNDEAVSLGLTLASKFDPTRPRDQERVVALGPDGGILRDSVVIGNAVRLNDMHIMRGLIGAEMNAGMQASSSSSFQARRGARQGGAFAGGNLFGDEEDEYDEGFIGSMAVDRGAIDEHRGYPGVYSPVVAGLSAQEPANIRLGTLAYNLDRLANLPLDALQRIASIVYYGAPWRYETLSNFDSNNILMPVNFLGFRVGLYEMALGIKCKAGGETGWSYFGHSDFMLADDAAIKVHYGNYTHYGKSVIHRPENVFIAYDIFPNRCLGGLGCRAYENRGQYQPQDQMFERDIFYIMVPFTETTFDKVMSMAGRFYTYMDAGMLDDEDPANRKLHYTTAAYYNRVWGWYSEEEVPIELDEPMYRLMNPGQNMNIWQGAQGTYNPDSHKFDKNIIRNKSPWGPNVAEGCRASRNGQMERVPVVPHGVLGF